MLLWYIIRAALLVSAWFLLWRELFKPGILGVIMYGVGMAALCWLVQRYDNARRQR